ncbi:MAG: hypothetical protein ACYCXF_05805 [Thermoleophilia bacterium]
MKAKIISILAALAFLTFSVVAAGCGTQAATDSSKLTQANYERIETGMSAAQLKTLAGAPARTEAKSMSGGHAMADGSTMGGTMTSEYWYYQGDKGWVRVKVADGKVSSKSGY